MLSELLDQLKEDGLAENTIVFHWSDHGPLPRGKRWPYDSGIHVPMIVRWPGHLEPGSVSERRTPRGPFQPARRLTVADCLSLPSGLAEAVYTDPARYATRSNESVAARAIPICGPPCWIWVSE